MAALTVALGYVGCSLWFVGEIDFKGQAAPVAVSAFSLITSVLLLLDLARLRDTDLGKLQHERASLIIGLIFVCVYLPISIGTSFRDVVTAHAAGAAPAKR